MPYACCVDRTALCDRCLDEQLAQLRGVAACRGDNWAVSVAARVARRDPWPEYEGRVRGLARMKVRDLANDERLREQLARACYEHAVRRWNALSDKPPGIVRRYLSGEQRKRTKAAIRGVTRVETQPRRALKRST